MPLGTEVGLGPGDFVLDGDSAPPPEKGAQPPKFSTHVYCGQTGERIKMALGMEVGFGPGHILLDGDPAPPSQKGAEAPIFGPFLLWPIMEVGLGTGHIVLDRDSAPPPQKKGAQPPNFRPLFWPDSSMDQHATWYGGRPRPGRHCVRWGSSSPLRKRGHSSFPNFRPMSIVAKRLYASGYHLVLK